MTPVRDLSRESHLKIFKVRLARLSASDDPAKWIDMSATAHYPRPNAIKASIRLLNRFGDNCKKTIVRRGINIERGQLMHTGVSPKENRNEKIDVGINRVCLLHGFYDERV